MSKDSWLWEYDRAVTQLRAHVVGPCWNKWLTPEFLNDTARARDGGRTGFYLHGNMLRITAQRLWENEADATQAERAGHIAALLKFILEAV